MRRGGEKRDLGEHVDGRAELQQLPLLASIMPPSARRIEREIGHVPSWKDASLLQVKVGSTSYHRDMWHVINNLEWSRCYAQVASM